MPAAPTVGPSFSPGVTSDSRDARLDQVLNPDLLPTPPGIALQVVQAVSRPDCDPAKVADLVSCDPTLCANLLKVVNSSVYGLPRPVASISRLITVLGLNTVRTLTLGFSLPAMRAGSPTDPTVRAYWLTAVGGGILARELAKLTRRPSADDDLVAGLLRDLGTVPMQQAYPDAWAAYNRFPPERRLGDPCGVEAEVFGMTHPEVTAEWLRRWNLPEEIVEPVRYHHQPEGLAGRPVLADRAQHLYFADLLTRLDEIAQFPDVLNYVQKVAGDRYGLSVQDLGQFLGRVVPKIEEFGSLLRVDIGRCPDFASVLATGAMELVTLSVQVSRTVGNSRQPAPASATMQDGRPPAGGGPASIPSEPVLAPAVNSAGKTMPAFAMRYLDEFPETGCRLDEYELCEVLGRGGMGVVFKGYEPSLDRFVAVKLLVPSLAASSDARRHFIREARLAAAIQHENVVAIHAVREWTGVPYLAMEYLPGMSLEHYVARTGALPIGEVVSIARQVLAGLSAAHDRHILHRDIKLANILFKPPAGGGNSSAAEAKPLTPGVTVKLTDFGLARGFEDAKRPELGRAVGTPHYMSPEQVEGKPSDARSDLYSFGVVLYVLSTGVLPFPGVHAAEVYRAVREQIPTPPRKVRMSVPQWLDAAIVRLLRKYPRDRYQTAQELAAVFANASDK